MASVIRGFEYDIFISYRQKDNKGDRWVSEFVDALKTELESTFKEEISVFFDVNPHDGLLETHDVDASLKDKLRCLIFIPIISQTYCDSRSYAWNYEFCVFNELAKNDHFGREVRLKGGNVASRILPVKIHDLDRDDIKLLEDELGGPLRSIDFIYKSPGVNRPLRAREEHPQDNLNKTYYRDQINKVANSAKSIISALKRYDQPDTAVSQEVFTTGHKLKNIKPGILAGSVIVIVLAVAGYFFIPKSLNYSPLHEKTIAVLPFRNLSNDSAQLYFCDGFTEEILNNLQKVQSFTVRSRTSADQYRNTHKSVTTIGNELNVNFVITGSVGREGDEIKIWIQLIDSKNDKPLWSNDYTRELRQLFSLQSEIAKEIASELKAVLTPEEIKKIDKKPTENLEAHNYFLQGNYYFWKNYSAGENQTAIELYEKAIELDPKFAMAYTGIANCFLDRYFHYKDRSEEMLRKSKEMIDKAFEIDPGLPDAHLALGNYYYQGYMDYARALEQYEVVLKEQPKNAMAICWSAAVHRRIGNWAKAKELFEKACALEPGRAEMAEDAGETFDLLREYSKAEEYYNASIILSPDWFLPYYFLSQMYIRWKGDTRKAGEILENAARNNKAVASDSLYIETKALINMYEGNYSGALNNISQFRNNIISSQFWYRPKNYYMATFHGLMDNTESEKSYYDSTRIFLEKKLETMPDDPRLLSSLGIAYAGLGFDEKAIASGEKAVKLLPVSAEAYKGIYLVEDLARIYVMTGRYEEAIREIRYLLSVPGFLSVKMLEINPIWAPLKDQPEFSKILEDYTL